MSNTTRIKELADKKTLDAVKETLNFHDNKLSYLDDKVSLIESRFHHVYNTLTYEVGESKTSTPSQAGYLLYDDGKRFRCENEKIYCDDNLILDNSDNFGNFYQLFYPYIKENGVPPQGFNTQRDSRPSIYNFKRNGDILYLYVFFYYFKDYYTNHKYYYYFEYDYTKNVVLKSIESRYYYTTGGSVEQTTDAYDAFKSAKDANHIYVSTRYKENSSSSRGANVQFFKGLDGSLYMFATDNINKLICFSNSDNTSTYVPEKIQSPDNYDFKWVGAPIYNVVPPESWKTASISHTTGSAYNIVHYNQKNYVCTSYNGKTYLYELDLESCIVNELVSYIIPFTNICNCDLSDDLYIGQDCDNYLKTYTHIDIISDENGVTKEINSLVTVQHVSAKAGETILLDNQVNPNSSFILGDAYFVDGSDGSQIACSTSGRIQVITFN